MKEGAQQLWLRVQGWSQEPVRFQELRKAPSRDYRSELLPCVFKAASHWPSQLNRAGRIRMDDHTRVPDGPQHNGTRPATLGKAHSGVQIIWTTSPRPCAQAGPGQAPALVEAWVTAFPIFRGFPGGRLAALTLT